jgi:hypothetical protein
MLKSIYYSVKPFIPRSLQIAVRRKVVSWKKGKVGNIWPIDPNSSKVPAGWKGWPNRKKFTVILTHDVDTAKGQEKCLSLLSMEEELGFRSSFNFVPETFPKITLSIQNCGRRLQGEVLRLACMD